jgi:hypothetical protein
MKLFLFAFFTCIILFGCGDFSKGQYISSYEAFVTEASDKYKDYTEAERTAADAKFKKFSEEDFNKFKANFTPEEKAKVNQLTGKFYAIVAKQKATQISNEINNLLDKTKGVLEEINK